LPRGFEMKRILTTHVGSLARPRDLLDQMKEKLAGKAPRGYDERVRRAVAECVRKQSETGIDIVTDGEQSKPGFSLYVRERLEGFEPRPQMKRPFFPAEVNAFPEYYAEYFKQAMIGGAIAPVVPLVCVGPVKYRGEQALKRDIDNLKAALKGARHHAAFMPAVAPSGVGSNEYYRSEEEFLHAVGAALRTEYQAIVDAGFLLQVDDPFLTDIFADPALDAAPGPQCTSRRSTGACAGFRRRRCAFTPAMASTRARASTRRRCRTSSATCSR